MRPMSRCSGPRQTVWGRRLWTRDRPAEVSSPVWKPAPRGEKETMGSKQLSGKAGLSVSSVLFANLGSSGVADLS